MANFLTKTGAGLTKLVAAITTSAGVGDADKIVATNAQGQIDSSFLPDKTTNATADNALSAGDFVTFTATGVDLADNTSIDTAAEGFVLATVAQGAAAKVYLIGENTGVTATAGTTYYLGTGGGITASPPAFVVGTICQQLGYATAANKLQFEYNEPVEYGNQ